MRSGRRRATILIIYVILALLAIQGCSGKHATENGTLVDAAKNITKTGENKAKQQAVDEQLSENDSSKEIKNIETKNVDKPISTDADKFISTKEELRPILLENLQQGKDTVFTASEELIKQGLDKISINIAETAGFGGYISNVEYSKQKNKVSLHFNYRGGKDNFLKKFPQVEAKVKKVVASVVKSGMTEFQKELALHDYVVNNTKYDYEKLKSNSVPDDDFTAYGVLINKTAVCEGYAEAMYRLLSAAGIENKIAIGTGAGTPHAWNIVKIDGKYYHLDTTFDDPISNSGDVLSYNYFNITDSQMAKDHTWTKSDYPACTSTAANYYIKKGLYAKSSEEYYNIVRSGLEKKLSVIRCKISSDDTEVYKKDIVYEVVKSNEAFNYVDMSDGYSFSYDPNNRIYEFYVKYK